MRTLKHFAARALHRLKLADLLLSRHYLFVLAYHRIKAREPASEYPFDEAQYGPDVDTFEEEMLWLKRNTRVLSQDELIDLLERERRPLGPYSFVTFDDGYVDNYTLAFPVLRQLGLPACFFIPTAITETRTLGWWDIIAYLIKTTTKERIVIDGRELSLDSGRRSVISYLQGRMKLGPFSETATLVRRVSSACQVELPSRALQDSELMTWDQIAEVARNNIAIGSHGHTHRVLARLERSDQEFELMESKRALEEKLGQPVKSLALPVGGPQHYTSETLELARNHNYALVFSFGTGFNPIMETSPTCVRRIGAPIELYRLSSTCAFGPRIPSGIATRLGV